MLSGWYKSSVIGVGVLFFLAGMTAHAENLPVRPVLKDKSCPTGYRTSGKYCVPGKNARFALPKVGSCPTGYRTSGRYCLAGKNARLAIPKNGSCPTGYHTSGAYCLAH